MRAFVLLLNFVAIHAFAFEERPPVAELSITHIILVPDSQYRVNFEKEGYVPSDEIADWIVNNWLAQKIVLNLDFNGGQFKAIKDLGSLLETYKKTGTLVTRVASGAVCWSSCVLLYMHGTERVAGRKARFGFHAAYNGFATKETPSAQRITADGRFVVTPTGVDYSPSNVNAKMTQMFQEALKLLGASSAWLYFQDILGVFSTIEGKEYFASELGGSNIVNHLID